MSLEIFLFIYSSPKFLIEVGKIDTYSIVQDDRMSSLDITLDFVCLRKSHFCHVIRVGTNLKLAGLKKT